MELLRDECLATSYLAGDNFHLIFKKIKSIFSYGCYISFISNCTLFRQTQAAVLEAIPRLHSMNIRTKRPDDYFAQMAKTDEHMNKIRTKLLSKEQGQERLEKMSKLRELKKYGKKVQV